MNKLLLSFIAIFTVSAASAQNYNPRHPSWTDSFEANGFCWCASTNFDHNLDEKTLRINNTDYNIVDVCDELEKHPLYRSFQNGDAPYNDIQCGNGPANDAPDEEGCPGRTDIGRDGCNQIGPKFDMTWLESRDRFGGEVTVPPLPPGGSPNIVHITKRNARDFAFDGDNGGANKQNIYLYDENENNINQQWIEIDRGSGYYSYQKQGTDFCIDGNRRGARNQNVYLWQCGASNQNQHWQKVDVGGGAYKLIKRNAPEYALNGGNAGANGQNVNLWNSSVSSQNLHWVITPVSSSATALKAALESNGVSIFPNPVFTNMTVRGAAEATITIYDSSGRAVLAKNLISDDEVLNLNEFKTGLYIARITGVERSTTFKIVKD